MWFRRGSYATVALVGVLSFAMPTAAFADTNPVVAFLAPIAALGGGTGVAAAAPEAEAAMAGVCATGVGCAVLATAAVGAGLYMTRDTWIPWLKNAFGQESAPSSGTCSGANANLMSPCDIQSDPGGPALGEVNGGYRFAANQINGCCANAGWYVSTTWVTSTGTRGSQSHQGTGVQTMHGTPEIIYYPINGYYLPPAGARFTSVHAELYNWSPKVVFLDWGAPTTLPDSGIRVSNQVNCVNPDGSTFSVTQGVDGVDGGLAPMPTCVGAAGSQPGAHGVCVTTSAGAIGGPMVVQSSNCAATALAQGTIKALYPNCVGANYCTYVIRHNGVPCEVGVPGCTDWAIQVETAPLEYQCWYGPYELPLANCKGLERIYEVTTTQIPATGPNTDGDPRTYDLPLPGYWPSGGAPTTLPTPLPTTRPTSSPAPDPGTGPAPGPVPGGANPTPTSDSADCFPSGWTVFNPAEWVLKPIKCALSWAFVPRTATLATLAGSAKTDLSTQGIGPMVTAVNANMSKVGSGTGCDGPAVTFSAVGIVKPMHPFSACTTPMSTLAGITNAMTTIAVILGGGFIAVRAIGAGFGFNFSMRRGGDES